jgi:hypothetical protein
MVDTIQANLYASLSTPDLVQVEIQCSQRLLAPRAATERRAMITSD